MRDIFIVGGGGGKKSDLRVLEAVAFLSVLNSESGMPFTTWVLLLLLPQDQFTQYPHDLHHIFYTG